MVNKITFGTTSISDDDIRNVVDCLKTGFVSPGKYTKQFEEEIAETHGYKYGVACNSGGSAILVAATAAMELYGIKSISVPAITYIQSIAPLLKAGLKIRFLDVTPVPNPEPVYEDCPANIDAHLPVHLLGKANVRRPPNPAKIVIEDNAQSIYAPGVGFGLACCLSFNSTHLITNGAGGMILTNDKDFAHRCWQLIWHGRREDRSQADCAELQNHYIFTEIGYSMKTSDINSALGLSQHDQRWKFIKYRRENAKHLIKGLQGIDNIMLPECAGNTFMCFQIVVKDDSREALRAKLHEASIETRPLFPITNQPIIKKVFGEIEDKYPGAKFLNDHGFFFGVHQNLNYGDLNRIIEIIRSFYKC